MDRADAATLFDYLYWARDRVLDAADRVPANAFTGPAPTLRPLRDTLVHELDVEWSWRNRLMGRPADTWDSTAELQPADFVTVDAIRERWATDEAEMRAWLASLTDEDLERPPDTERAPVPLSFYLLHVVTHALQQLADAATALTGAGHGPGELEFLEYADHVRHGRLTAR